MNEVIILDMIGRSLAGDRQSAQDLLAEVQVPVFNLAMRYLGEPESARDASQEICLKVWTKLGSFQGRSAFRTWVLAIAANHLSTARKSHLEQAGISFEAYESELAPGALSPAADRALDNRILAEELRHSCSLGMLQCLDREDRLIYVLHAFFGVSSQDGGAICALSPAAYRQRLSRTRRKMADFLGRVCGLAGKGAACRCQDRVLHALRQGRISEQHLRYSPLVAEAALHAGAVAEMTRTMEILDAESAVFRQSEAWRQPDGPAAIKRLLAQVAPALSHQQP